MIILKDTEEKDLILFTKDEEKLAKFKVWGLASSKAMKIPKIYYKGIYADGSVECDVVGYIEKFTRNECIDQVYETVVIKVGESTHKISPAYLKDMNKKGR